MQTTRTWGGLVRLIEELDSSRANHVEQRAELADEMELVPGMEYCPTTEQIQAECQRIQSEWSERERWRRAGFASGRAPRWTPPRTTTPAFDNQDLAWAV